MFDRQIQNFTQKPLIIIAKLFLKFLKPNQVTILGFILGFFMCILIFFQFYFAALALLLLNRFCDGLDGHVARNSYVSDLGGFYDITFDFIVYSLLPIGFILNDTQNAMAFSFLLSAFIGTSSTFLASAWIIEKNKNLLKEKFQKSFFYTRGITEGFETILFFILMFLFPSYAYFFAWIFGILCWITVFTRILFIRMLFNS